MASIHIDPALCITAGAILCPVSVGMVGLRMYVRKVQKVSPGVDDWLTIPALLLFIGMCIAMLIGVGEHTIGYKTPPPDPGKTVLTTTNWTQSETKHILWAVELLQIPALTALKLSFIFFYYRLFSAKIIIWYKWSLNLMIALVSAWGIAYFFAYLFLCPGRPDAYWISLMTEKEHCIDSTVLHNSYGTTDFILDFIIFVLPVLPVLRLKMPIKKRLGLIGIFFLGAGSIVASAIRMVTYWTSTAIMFSPQGDIDLLLTGGIYWSVLECGIGLICCCLPSCSYLLFKNRRLTRSDNATRYSVTSPQNAHRFTVSHSLAPRGWHSRSFVTDSDFKLDNMSQSS